MGDLFLFRSKMAFIQVLHSFPSALPLKGFFLGSERQSSFSIEQGMGFKESSLWGVFFRYSS